ncbi:hypothetical protein [Dokdonella sp.]|uniref:hypothetical protein n=1 Tax=Dokdonella sp. TaxID=2291710 RepID=UPI00321F7563
MNPGRSALALLFAIPAVAAAATLRVGPGQPFATPCAAVAAANHGDTIEVDAAGNYAGNVCTWTRNGLTLRGVNGRPHIPANGQHAQGKAIWVIAGNDTTIENVEMSGCTVPDGNGAAIRQEGTNLTLRGVHFHHNQNGILTSANPASTITIEYSEFAYNGTGTGYTHNLYIGHVGRFVFRHSWSHHANVGHLLKSRAMRNDILYSRLTGETGANASYELTLPNGGLAFVIGNLIQQPATSQNRAMLDYLSEGAGANTDHRLFVVNNTFVNARSNGTFLNIHPGTSEAPLARNNIFHGAGTVTSHAGTVLDHNYTGSAALFVDPSNYDYRLLPTAAAVIDAGVAPGNGAGESLAPVYQYVHPADAMLRPLSGAIDIGAYEYHAVADLIFRDGFEAN